MDSTGKIDIGAPPRKYSILYADPPWKYADHGCKGAAAFHYPCMSLTDLATLPVPDLAADDCALFLWTTYPMIREALQLMDAWGFTYKTLAFQWVKTYSKSVDKYFFGLGRWTRGNTEPCFLGVKGKPRRVSAKVSQLIVSPVRKHSRKPDEAREKIVELMGDLPRLELFARERVPGWDCWGDEV